MQRIQPGRWFIQDQYIGIKEECQGSAYFLPGATRKGSHSFVEHFIQAKGLQ